MKNPETIKRVTEFEASRTLYASSILDDDGEVIRSVYMDQDGNEWKKVE